MKLIPNKIVQAQYGPMIVNSQDQYIGASIQQFGSWDGADINLIAEICKFLLTQRGHLTLYDVGANIGSHTVPLAQQFGGQMTIRAFEAQRQVYYVLCGNVAINGLPNVYCYHAAVSDQNHVMMDIAVPDYTESNNFGGVELVAATNSDNQNMIKSGHETVMTITLDSFEEPVDFIKMDVEGMEHLALKGCLQILQHRPVCYVEVAKTDQQQVRDIFSQANYTAYAYKPGDWIFVPKESNLVINGVPKIVLE